MLNIDKEKWCEIEGYFTAKEISQQPKLWEKTLSLIEDRLDEVKAYLDKYMKNDNVRIILTGAGTSAYIGDTVAPYISKITQHRVESIATTDIVSSPESYLEKKTPTILVSFARSGDSPESVATFLCANKYVEDIMHIVVTCNADGELAKKAQIKNNSLVLLLPEESNDKGFAMTSSFTCMMLTALMIFDLDNYKSNKNAVLQLALNAVKILENCPTEIEKIVDLEYERIVYLGSSTLSGLAKEGALKILELTKGNVIAVSESVLGFRHGPKSIVNDKTLIFMFISNDEYTYKYDMDLLREIANDQGEKKVVAITFSRDSEIEKYADYTFIVDEQKINFKDDSFSSLAYILFAQVFALFYSKKLGITPDNPCPEGTVNRVVKGVKIYDI